MIESDRIIILEGIDINNINNQKNVKFVIIGILKILVLSMKHFFVMVVMA